LIPDVDFITFNNTIYKKLLKTAGIILETIQGGAGFIQPQNDFLKKVRKRCTEVGAMMILDEIQPGFGRTGALLIPKLRRRSRYSCNGERNGMPVGAFTASSDMMHLLSTNPKLGHITTFGDILSLRQLVWLL
jgi:acetylornithine/succinyldiaminopimelate/putrescine aminotransferase